jgi:hypothetical protein
MSVPNVPQEPMPPAAPPPRPPRSLGRRIAATIGIIIMVLTGGCTLALIGDSGSDPYGMIGVFLVVGGVPFLFGALITWLALRR